MAGRVPRRRRQSDEIVERVVVVDQQPLPGLHHRLAVEAPDVAGRIFFLLRRLLPGGVFALVEDVFRLREGRHPAAVHQPRVPAAMVDVQMGAEHVVDVLEAQPARVELVEPALLREVERRRVALVLAGAGVHQDRMMRRAHHEGLVGDHHAVRRAVEHEIRHLCEVPVGDFPVVFREEILRPTPRAIALDDAGDRRVADLDLFHSFVPPRSGPLPGPLPQGGGGFFLPLPLRERAGVRGLPLPKPAPRSDRTAPPRRRTGRSSPTRLHRSPAACKRSRTRHSRTIPCRPGNCSRTCSAPA